MLPCPCLKPLRRTEGLLHEKTKARPLPATVQNTAHGLHDTAHTRYCNKTKGMGQAVPWLGGNGKVELYDVRQCCTYINSTVVGFSEIARSAACLVSNSQAKTARPYPNRLRISQSARGDPEGAAELRGGLCSPRRSPGPATADRTGPTAGETPRAVRGVSRPISRPAK